MLNSKTRILFLYSAFSRGGIEKILCQVANSLVPNYKVTVVVFKVLDKKYYEDIKNTLKFHFINLDCYSLPSHNILGLFIKIGREVWGAYRYRQVLKNVSPTEIICVDPHGVFWSKCLAKCYSSKIYMWWHFTVSSYISQRTWFLKKVILERVDGHIVLCNDMAVETSKEFPRTKVTIIRNMVDITDNDFVKQGKDFVYVGRIDGHSKRLDRLFKALSSLNCDWHLQVIGDGQDRELLKNLARGLNIDNRITWSGWQTYPWQCIDSGGFGILSSDYEGFSLVTAEGIYHGLPYICMDCPVGPREIIKEGVNGTLVPLSKNENENVKNLTLTLQKALEGEIKVGTQKEMRESAKQFTPENIIKGWIELLETN